MDASVPRTGLPGTVMTIDILCRVVDNYGDIGVVYRLARTLSAAYPELHLRLIVDNLHAFASLEPVVLPTVPLQRVHGWVIAGWQPLSEGELEAGGFVADPPTMVLECFACGRPDWYESLLFDASRKDVRHIINLEYLSAEAWVDEVHRMPSATRSELVRKYVFMPGFSRVTGGLLSGICAVPEKNAGSEPGGAVSVSPERCKQPPDSIRVLVFSYERDYSGIVADLASAHAAAKADPAYQRTVEVFAAAGRSQTCVINAWERAGEPFPLRQLPFMPQEKWDALFASCNALIVRGEDSMAQAALSGVPFLWHAYPQEGRHHLVKVRALLDRMRPHFDSATFAPVEESFIAFNDRDTDSPTERGRESIAWMLGSTSDTGVRRGFASFAESLRANGNLAAHLMTFIREIVYDTAVSAT